jgi:hypothetical protein
MRYTNSLALVRSTPEPMLRLGIRLFVVCLYTLACFYWLGLYVGFFGVWVPLATHCVISLPTGFFICIAPRNLIFWSYGFQVSAAV